MLWHDSDSLTLPRSEEQLLTIVENKAAHIRHRRLQALTGGVGALVLVVGCLVVVGRGGDGGGTPVRAAAGNDAADTPYTAIDEPLPGSVTATSPELVPPTPGPLPEPPAGSAAPSRTGASSSAVAAPAAPPAPANTGSGAAGSPAPDADWPPRCDASEIAVTAVTDRPTYRRGDDVVLTMTARNVGPRGCFPPYGYMLELFDPAGNGLGGQGAHADYASGHPPPALEPGQSTTQTATWPDFCVAHPECPADPAGTYTVRATVNGYAANPASFTISG